MVATVGIVSAHAPLSAVGSPISSSATVADTADDPSGLDAAPVAALDDTLRGRSGKLFARFVNPERSLAVETLRRLFGEDAGKSPGLFAFVDSAIGAPSFTFIAMRPFSDKTEGRIGRYRIGFWPAERRAARRAGYENPEGFIEVTPENQETRVSEHFRLRDFLTKGQSDVWPKYLVLREDLVDKLELVIADLESRGIEVEQMRVMSGFRTPSYNANGGNTAGRASNSRHMYGDAADVFVDNDGDWRMDDLNGDGRSDTRDAAVIRAAVERVERAWPDLVGGVGVYRATSAHGPFAHVDVRGYRARWGSE
ncbi:MAG TPA: D-Ala-D-Ala carboxypeptidase family metallohydrolase [Gemmatimonadaceae bacterium]